MTDNEAVENGWFRRISEQPGRAWLGGSAILAFGLIAGGYLMGDGLVRMKQAERSVIVRGLERGDRTGGVDHR